MTNKRAILMDDATTKPIILIDMDGVLADFDAEIANRVKNRHPHIALLETRDNFYLSEDYPEYKALIRAISNEAGFFESLPLIDHAIEGWQRIIDLGYHPRICSSPIRSNPHSESEKRAWLQRHFSPLFGDSVATDAIITSDKHLFEGLALIDDRPELRNANNASWQHIIFDQPYNQTVDKPRIHGWLDTELAATLRAVHQSRLK
jgi:5'-nucleotidase